jgi:hypothetical protein
LSSVVEHAATDGDAGEVALTLADAAGDELAGCAGVAEALGELLVDAHPAVSVTVHSRAAAAPARRAAGADGVMGGIPLSQRGHWLVPGVF